jgi:hypothetical protein
MTPATLSLVKILGGFFAYIVISFYLTYDLVKKGYSPLKVAGRSTLIFSFPLILFICLLMLGGHGGELAAMAFAILFFGTIIFVIVNFLLQMLLARFFTDRPEVKFFKVFFGVLGTFIMLTLVGAYFIR